MKQNAYGPSLYEALATLKVKKKPAGRDDRATVRFRASGRQFSLSANQIDQRLGFYTAQEVAPRRQAGLLADWPSNEVRMNFWWEVTQPDLPYVPGRSHARHLRRPAHRIVHRLLAHGIIGRSANPTRMYDKDLFCIWSMVTRTPIHMGLLAVQQFSYHANDRTATIFIGPILTRILQSFNLGDQLEREAIVGTFQPIAVANLNRMMIQRRGPEGEEQPEEPHAPPPAAPHPPMQGYPPVPPEYPPVTSFAELQAFQYQLFLQMQNLQIRQMDQQSAFQEQVYGRMDTMGGDITSLRSDVNDIRTAWRAQFPDSYPFPPPPPPQP